MSDTPNYEYYVVHDNPNRPCKDNIEMWNIFNNWCLSEDVFRLCKKHLRNKKKFTFDELKSKIDREIQYYMWARCEYEVLAGSLFMKNPELETKKIDAYWQAEPNMYFITEMCITRTKEFLKEKRHEV